MFRAVWNTGDGTKFAGEWNGENETITSAIVADGVVDLSTGEWEEIYEKVFEKGAFQFCSRLETVRLPESLRKIGDYAFSDCKALVHVDIPSGVNEIGGRAFQGSSLETVTIPEGIVDLPECIFAGCESLESVKLPSSLNTIGSCAFCACKKLASINSDDIANVIEIGTGAFRQCSSLSSFKIPPNVVFIENCTFFQCERLERIELPQRLRDIHGQKALRECHRNLVLVLSPDSEPGKDALKKLKDLRTVKCVRVDKFGQEVEHINWRKYKPRSLSSVES